jgi:hypothetical protein
VPIKTLLLGPLAASLSVPSHSAASSEVLSRAQDAATARGVQTLARRGCSSPRLAPPAIAATLCRVSSCLRGWQGGEQAAAARDLEADGFLFPLPPDCCAGRPAPLKPWERNRPASSPGGSPAEGLPKPWELPAGARARPPPLHTECSLLALLATLSGCTQTPASADPMTCRRWPTNCDPCIGDHQCAGGGHKRRQQHSTSSLGAAGCHYWRPGQHQLRRGLRQHNVQQVCCCSCQRSQSACCGGFTVVPKTPGCQPAPAPHCRPHHFLFEPCRPYGGVGAGGTYGGAGYGTSMYGGTSSMYGGASGMYGGGYGAGAGMYGRPGMYGGGGMYGSGEVSAGKGAAAFCNPRYL